MHVQWLIYDDWGLLGIVIYVGWCITSPWDLNIISYIVGDVKFITVYYSLLFIENISRVLIG